jgi:hypothetical protein
VIHGKTRAAEHDRPTGRAYKFSGVMRVERRPPYRRRRLEIGGRHQGLDRRGRASPRLAAMSAVEFASHDAATVCARSTRLSDSRRAYRIEWVRGNPDTQNVVVKCYGVKNYVNATHPILGGFV